MSTMAGVGRFAAAAVACLLFLNCHARDTLEVLEEAEVKQLVQEEQYVVVLLSSSSGCDGVCGVLEDTLASIREDVVEALNAWVVRTHSKHLADTYGLTATKVGVGIVFLRSGVPLLYTGPPDDDELMLMTLVSNTQPLLKTLNDDTFEHDTQASTGATTGDWLVMFAKDGCERCDQLRATLEAVAASTKGRKNVAVIQRDVDGGQTTRRFGVKEFPSLILFRLGRLYRYDLPLLDAATLHTFVSDGFRNSRAEDIPHPKTPFDDLTEKCADWLRENPSVVSAVLYAVVGVAVLIAAAMFWPNKPKETKKKK